MPFRIFFPILTLSILANSVGAQESPNASVMKVDQKVSEALKTVVAPHAHALRAQNLSAERARAQINLWIRFNIEKAFAMRSSGDMEGALFHLAMAKHALQDSVRPNANDENGDPKVFNGAQPHSDTEPKTQVWRDRVAEDIQAMFENSFVPAGDLLRMYGIDTDEGPIDRPNQLPRPIVRKQP